jgi:hypothetical protein
MANNITKILFRQGTNVQRISATSTNPNPGVIFNAGEPAYTYDTKRLFVGDGVTYGGTPVGIVNYGSILALSGSYSNSNLTQAAYQLLSAALVGDLVYDQASSTLYTLTAASFTPNLSNLIPYNISVQFNTSQFTNPSNTLTIKTGGVTSTEINSTALNSSQNILTGGNGSQIGLRPGSIGNAYIAVGPSNSIKVTNSTGTAIQDVQIAPGQVVGYSSATGGSFGTVTLAAGTGLTLSANPTTYQFNFSNPGLLPASGGILTGNLSATGGVKFITSTSPVNPYDVVNLTFLQSVTGTGLPINITALANYLPLSGNSTLTGPITSKISVLNSAPAITLQQINGTVLQVLDNFNVSQFNLNYDGSVSTTSTVTANKVIVQAAPVNAYDLTNKTYTDGKYIPFTGGNLTGNLNALTPYKFTTSTTPTNSNDVVNLTYLKAVTAALPTPASAQVLSFNQNTAQLTISNGNTVSLSALSGRGGSGTVQTASNAGTGTGVYYSGGSTTSNLAFKSLSAGTGISISDNGTGTVTVTNTNAFNPVYTGLTGNGTTTLFTLNGGTTTNAAAYRVDLNGVLQAPTVDYTIPTAGNISFTKAPYTGAAITVVSYF